MRSALVALPGQPDQVCDMVAEAIVDEYLRRDPEARVRVSVSGGRGALFVSGDVKSTADFDVSAIVRRTLGAVGVMVDLEPFISLETVAPSQVESFMRGGNRPVVVTGYATAENELQIPGTVRLAKEIAKTLERYRHQNEDGFWLGGDGEVTVFAELSKPTKAIITVEHGAKTLVEARTILKTVLQPFLTQLDIQINPYGPIEARGIAEGNGVSGQNYSPYGSGLPSMPTSVGRDPSHPTKAGAWLARAEARRLLKETSAKAIWLQAEYLPGEQVPAVVQARDDRGKDVSSLIKKDALERRRVMAEWWRQDLCVDAARWGCFGEPELPWESAPASGTLHA